MTMSASITSGQKDSIGSLVVSAARKGIDLAFKKVDADKDGWQQVFENGNELADAIVETILAKSRQLSKSNQFANEEIVSTYGYPKGWYLKSPMLQARILTERFPGLDVSHVVELAGRYRKDGKFVLPSGMDGLAVFPKHSAIARLSGETNEYWPSYNRAFAHLLTVMSQARSDFVDYTEGNVGPEYERLAAKTAAIYEELENVPGDVLVLAVQTGMFHRAKSIRRARVVFGQREFGLDSFAVGIILLTHPERLQHVDHLWIDCAGSERAPRADGGFSRASYWSFRGGELGFLSCRVDDANPDCGSASGAPPE